VLKAAARQHLAAAQGELDLGLERAEPAGCGAGGGPVPITSSRAGHLWDALARLEPAEASRAPVHQGSGEFAGI